MMLSPSRCHCTLTLDIRVSNLDFLILNTPSLLQPQGRLAGPCQLLLRRMRGSTKDLEALAAAKGTLKEAARNTADKRKTNKNDRIRTKERVESQGKTPGKVRGKAGRAGSRRGGTAWWRKGESDDTLSQAISLTTGSSSLSTSASPLAITFPFCLHGFHPPSP